MDGQVPRSRGRTALVIAVLLVTAIVVLGAIVVVRALRTSSGGGGADGAGSEVCGVLRPRGLLPSEWFDAEGGLVLTAAEAGQLALSLGARASYAGDDTGPERTASDLLATRPNADPQPLDTDQRAALAELDESLAEDCPA